MSRYLYLKKYRKQKLERGECRDCKNTTRPGRAHCSECFIKAQKRHQELRTIKKNLGLCPVCGVQNSQPGKITCQLCIQNVIKNKKIKFFLYRSTHFNGAFGTKHTPKEIASIWKKQWGLCALTGCKLTAANAELDHIIPKSKNGSHELDNLRWVTKLANRAKRDLLDFEFIAMCRNVVRTCA